MIKKLATLFGAAVLLAATPAYADIDTTSFDGGDVQPFGAVDTATYGQTFAAGVGDTTLSSFSLFLRGRQGGAGTLDLRGYLAEWDGTKAGALLYTSSIATMNALGDFQEFSFAPAIAVVAGRQYVAFLSVSDLPAQAESLFGMPLSNDATAGGFVYQNNSGNYSSLYTTDWASFGGTDAFFKADFTSGAVPEPATWALMIGGFGMVGSAVRRRRAVVAA